MRLRDDIQELRELGLRGTLFRASWEVRRRFSLFSSGHETRDRDSNGPWDWTSHLPLEDPVTLARWIAPLVPTQDLHHLRFKADEGAAGRPFCFGRRFVDYGRPINWHRNPVTGLSWNADALWSEVLGDTRPGDVKDCWEVARFPHAYHLARASAFFPDKAEEYAGALVLQMEHFVASNPVGRGIHWSSGQEVGFRLLAWLFALDVLLLRTKVGRNAAPMIRKALVTAAAEIERTLDYARIAVYNNHLLSEALALFGVGALFPELPDGLRWRDLGRRLLDEQADLQFYPDGAYIQQSHNYHRVAIQDYLWACTFARSMGDSPSPLWLRALERSLEFLYAHQNPLDGRLPNYGANDGALPSVLSTCDLTDMRPVLQAVSLLVRGTRIYEPGPWDESAAWFLGVRALDAPTERPARRSVSFQVTGYHVLRGHDEATFATFRCGTLRDRFSQIDMLHLDVWWKGLNVLADPGTFRYNAAAEWHKHFMGTAAHNTLTIDGLDQMLHRRQFKVLYWTEASLLRHLDTEVFTVTEGQHYGFQRHPGGCVHLRAVLHVKDGLWIVLDRIEGAGVHDVRLQWLGGQFEWSALPAGMRLHTPEGPFDVSVCDGEGRPVDCDVVAGGEDPPRGWLSRYYGEKVAVPSLVARYRGAVPSEWVSVLSGGSHTLTGGDGVWTVRSGQTEVAFRSVEGVFTDVRVTQ